MFSSRCSCIIAYLYSFVLIRADSTAPTGSNAAIIGGLVYRGSQFPSTYKGVYFFGDYARGWVKYLTFVKEDNKKNSGNVSVTGVFDFGTDMGAMTGFKTGIDGALYYPTEDKVHAILISMSYFN